MSDISFTEDIPPDFKSSTLFRVFLTFCVLGITFIYFAYRV